MIAAVWNTIGLSFLTKWKENSLSGKEDDARWRRFSCHKDGRQGAKALLGRRCQGARTWCPYRVVQGCPGALITRPRSVLQINKKHNYIYTFLQFSSVIFTFSNFLWLNVHVLRLLGYKHTGLSVCLSVNVSMAKLLSRFPRNFPKIDSTIFVSNFYIQ